MKTGPWGFAEGPVVQRERQGIHQGHDPHHEQDDRRGEDHEQGAAAMPLTLLVPHTPHSQPQGAVIRVIGTGPRGVPRGAAFRPGRDGHSRTWRHFRPGEVSVVLRPLHDVGDLAVAFLQRLLHCRHPADSLGDDSLQGVIHLAENSGISGQRRPTAAMLSAVSRNGYFGYSDLSRRIETRSG